MKRLKTQLDGPVLIEPRVLRDERGFFWETYRREVFAGLGVPEEMVQDNHSRSRRAIVRGMHFQVGEGAAKLVRCARGSIVDVMVDIRRGSPSFGEWDRTAAARDRARTAVHREKRESSGVIDPGRPGSMIEEAEEERLRRKKSAAWDVARADG